MPLPAQTQVCCICRNLKRDLVKGMQEDNTPQSSNELLGGLPVHREHLQDPAGKNKDSTWSLQEHDSEPVIHIFHDLSLKMRR